MQNEDFTTWLVFCNVSDWHEVCSYLHSRGCKTNYGRLRKYFFGNYDYAYAVDLSTEFIQQLSSLIVLPNSNSNTPLVTEGNLQLSPLDFTVEINKDTILTVKNERVWISGDIRPTEKITFNFQLTPLTEEIRKLYFSGRHL